MTAKTLAWIENIMWPRYVCMGCGRVEYCSPKYPKETALAKMQRTHATVCKGTPEYHPGLHRQTPNGKRAHA